MTEETVGQVEDVQSATGNLTKTLECPKCKRVGRSKVSYTRLTPSKQLRRRHTCSCSHRFTTYDWKLRSEIVESEDEIRRSLLKQRRRRLKQRVLELNRRKIEIYGKLQTLFEEIQRLDQQLQEKKGRVE